MQLGMQDCTNAIIVRSLREKRVHQAPGIPCPLHFEGGIAKAERHAPRERRPVFVEGDRRLTREPPAFEISRRFDCRVETHLLGASNYPPGEGTLHHWLAARNSQAVKRAQCRRKLPRQAAQQAARDEEDDPDAGSLVA
jgi:hypothetical protein